MCRYLHFVIIMISVHPRIEGTQHLQSGSTEQLLLIKNREKNSVKLRLRIEMKKLGIGYENYKEFIEQNLYYVDKTLLVRDILEKGGKVTAGQTSLCIRKTRRILPISSNARSAKSLTRCRTDWGRPSDKFEPDTTRMESSAMDTPVPSHTASASVKRAALQVCTWRKPDD
ncbi:MAG: hypothetical protein Q4F43_08125 [Eubacteriales bacterium]|nr:hypothetical protein [Eubacteriales bacterium]